MKLVVFDLDGTLTGTSSVDETCFVQAFSDSLNIHRLSTNWLDYEHATDSAVTTQAILKHSGRLPKSSEILKVVERFVELLRRHHELDSTLFAEVPGATAFLLELRQNPEWGIALATGGWQRSAQFKIEASGLPLTDLPAAFAEDGPSRESIVQTAIARASAWYRCREFERIVTVGDAVWDIKAARQLKLPFLGVATKSRAALLRDNGARHVVEHYLDPVQCLRCLGDAAVPIQPLHEHRT
jgi:phosphoglycolate phosphatase-like HAD superfamily hydrolase